MIEIQTDTMAICAALLTQSLIGNVIYLVHSSKLQNRQEKYFDKRDSTLRNEQQAHYKSVTATKNYVDSVSETLLSLSKRVEALEPKLEYQISSDGKNWKSVTKLQKRKNKKGKK